MKPILLFALLATTACTPAQTQAWKTAGIDALRCLSGSVVNAAGDALVDLLDRLDGASASSFDAKALGKDLALKYGKDAAVCAIGKAAASLLPAAGLRVSPSPKARMLQALLDSQNEWSK